MQVLVRSGGNRGAARLVDVDRDETVAAIKPRLLGVEPGHRTDDCWRVVHGSCYLDDERRLREYPQIRTGSTLELRGLVRGGVKKVKKKKKKDEAAPGAGGDDHEDEEEEDFPEMEFKAERWINLQVQLVTWDHLNFSMLVSTNTRLYAVIDKIKERHGGSVLNVALYRHEVHPQNLLPDLGATLGEAHFDGGLASDPSTEVLWYDYAAHSSDCPLLISSPRGASRKDIAVKVAEEAARLQAEKAKVEAAAAEKAAAAAAAAQALQEERDKAGGE